MKSLAKKSIAWLMALVIAISYFAVVGTPKVSAETSSDFEYTVMSDDTAMITGFNGNAQDYDNPLNVVIPETIDGHMVTCIGPSAFEFCTTISSVEIPDTVERIEHDAFSGCGWLSSITIPVSVSYIGQWAFYDCGLQSITILNPNAVIEDYAFGYFSFAGSSGTTTIYGYAGSTAEAYVNENPHLFFALIGTAGYPFIDVPQSGVYYTDAVRYVYQNGYMTGLTPDTFGPTETISRAQFAVIVYRFMDSPSVEGMNNPFSDNQSDSFYHDAVIWCSNAGIITGYYNADGSFTGNFGPADAISREQLVTMLYRFLCYIEMDFDASFDLSSFADSNMISPYAVEALQWAALMGIISGRQTTPPTIAPLDSASRADAAVIIQRFFNSLY